MKFPNFYMNKSFTARAFVLLASLFLMASAASAQKVDAPTASVPDVDQCSQKTNPACDWQNGNLNENNSTYRENDFVAYRSVFDNTANGDAVSFQIQYDTTESGGQHALDYLGTYNLTVTGANPCIVGNTTVCTGAGSTTNGLIPVDGQVLTACPSCNQSQHPVPFYFTLWNGSITSVSAITNTGTYAAASTVTITVNFTAGSGTPVLAWGGHISSRRDWAVSAISMSGSPYHMRRGPSGTDRSLKVSAVTFAGLILIEKTVVATNAADPTHPFTTAVTSFGFGSSQPLFGGVLTTFSLVDSVNEPFQVDPALRQGGVTAPSEEIFSFGPTNLVTVTEDVPDSPWNLAAITCTSTAGGSLPASNNNTIDLPGRNVQIQLEEGETVKCSFHNSSLGTTAAPASITGRVSSPDGAGLRGVQVKLIDVTTGEIRTASTNTFGYYTFTDLDTEDFYRITVTSKKYLFRSPVRSFTLLQDMFDMNFVSSE